jgi:ankyrin repeat protein
LKSLKFEQVDSRQSNIKAAHTKTCWWLLERREYQDWLDVTKFKHHYGFLWIKGNPGTGKSTLMKFAYLNAKQKIKDKTVISFFFNARGADLEKSTTGMYRSLLLQLLQGLPELQDRLLSFYKSMNLNLGTTGNEYKPFGAELLKAIFREAIRNLCQSALVCFIDALDECNEEQIRDMISFFQQLGEEAIANRVHLQVCFSSRHYPHITFNKGLSLILERQEGHKQDIINYVNNELEIGSEKNVRGIKECLQERASGVFMWVVLVVKMLNKAYDRGRTNLLRKMLQDIPRDLHELFRDILRRDGDDEDKEALLLCIQWVLFARQPLSPEQLYFAIHSGISPETPCEWDAQKITKETINRFILDSSKGLAETTLSEPPTVQFIHESIVDFLLSENGFGEIWTNIGMNFQGLSHQRLRDCCLNYINIDISTYLKPHEPLLHPETEEAEYLPSSVTDAFPLFEYSVRNILYHADASEEMGISQQRFMHNFPLLRWVRLDNLLQGSESRVPGWRTNGVGILYILAIYNMPNLIRSYPLATSYLDGETERYGPPLFAALVMKNREVVRAFFESHVARQPLSQKIAEFCAQYLQDENDCLFSLDEDFLFSKKLGLLGHLFKLDEGLVEIVLDLHPDLHNSKNRQGQKLLSLAAPDKFHNVLRSLLEKNDDGVNSPGENEGTVLLWAIQNGYNAIANLLLKNRDIDVNLFDEDGKTPIILAIENELDTTVRRLLEKRDIDVNLPDKNGKTPLLWAVEKTNKVAVELLLSKEQVNLDLADKDGRTPLSWAAVAGSARIFKLLMNAEQTKVDDPDKTGRTPLSWAASNPGFNQIHMVETLLNSGKVDVNSKDTNGRTPLSWAVVSGSTKVVRLLLTATQIDVNLADKDGRTPLSWAAITGSTSIIELLMNAEQTKMDEPDKTGRTSLSWAASNPGFNQIQIVEMLLNSGKVDVNSKDKDGRTPLSWAAVNGSYGMIKLLINAKQTKMDDPDKTGRTPLSWAAGNSGLNQIQIFEMLLNSGKVDVNSKDINGRTPLSWAAQTFAAIIPKKSRDLIDLFFNVKDIDVNLPDENGRTPLFWLIDPSCLFTVHHFLKTGAGKVNVNVLDRTGQTPLTLAAEKGWDLMVRLLSHNWQGS